MNTGLPSPYPSPGEVIDGKYQIDKILGEGGMGCVARAYHLILQNAVALKFMNPQFMSFPGAIDRFINEGVASRRIKNVHVVQVTETGKLPNGAPYLVMECLVGSDLADLLAHYIQHQPPGEPKGLPIPRAVHFMLQILRGLQSAHAVGIIHRDMKPSNCFVVRHEGEDDFIRILDFGISKVQQPGKSGSLTQTNSALGTPLYMSPEQARSPRDVDLRSDIYSVGVILYELLTGKTPFYSDSGEFTEILFKLFTEDAPPVKASRPDLPDELAAVVHKALARDVSQRYQDSLELAEALAPWADEHSKPFLTRMRAFKPEQALSMPPPENMALPPSMVAFNQLDARPATDLMANRPTTDVQHHPPATAALDARPPQKVKTEVLHESVSRVSAVPADAQARARPDEAGARTQFHSSPPADETAPPRPLVPGASTDMAGSHDVAHAPPSPSRSPIGYFLLAFAALAIGGIAFGVYAKLHGAPTTAGTATAPPPTVEISRSNAVPTTTPPPTASTAATPTPSATTSTAPSATASARPTATVTAKKPPPNWNTSGSSGVLDPNLH
jgi:serine/threonine-protein kinase